MQLLSPDHWKRRGSRRKDSKEHRVGFGGGESACVCTIPLALHLQQSMHVYNYRTTVLVGEMLAGFNTPTCTLSKSSTGGCDIVRTQK